MDIASAQWLFGQIGRLNRIDLRLNPGTDVNLPRALNRSLPAGTLAIAPQVERDRAVTVTRAYRVNLNMLALVALWTGAFLVFSTQSLSVLRRRRSFGLLRALGVTRELELALLGEGAALGFAGSRRRARARARVRRRPVAIAERRSRQWSAACAWRRPARGRWRPLSLLVF
jgi:putative ABC transport system permease protein